MDTNTLIMAGVVPGAVALAVLVGTWLLCLGTKEIRQPKWAAPLAFGLAYFPAYFATYSWPQWWSGDGTYRLPHVAMLLLIVGVFESIAKPSHRKRIRALHLLAIATLAILLLQPLYLADQGLWLALWVTGSMMVAWILSAFLNKQARLNPGWRIPFMLAVVPLAASFVLFYGHWASGAIHAGGLVAMLVAASLAAAIITKQQIAPGGITVFVGLLIALLLIGLNYASVQPIAAAIVLVAPFGLLAGTKAKWHRGNAWLSILVQLGVITIPLLIAFAIAYEHRPVNS
jgi:hypothetical protein